MNLFAFTGAVTIMNQWGLITSVTSLANCTNVFADAWDGTSSVLITSDGIDISGAEVDTLMFKDQINTSVFSHAVSDQVRIYETRDDDALGRPFTLVGKNGVTNYIRLHLTTNTSIAFSMFVNFRASLANGSTLEIIQ
jgi:hypothetical protein